VLGFVNGGYAEIVVAPEQSWAEVVALDDEGDLARLPALDAIADTIGGAVGLTV
jgi:hypothetical protein